MTKQLSRDEALAALAGDRFNAANLRVQIRLAEEQLKELGDFERRWDRFVQSLGSVVEAGTVEKVIRAPEHPYTQLLISSIPRMRAVRNWEQ